jgi:hypothetical protein
MWEQKTMDVGIKHVFLATKHMIVGTKPRVVGTNNLWLWEQIYVVGIKKWL